MSNEKAPTKITVEYDDGTKQVFEDAPNVQLAFFVMTDIEGEEDVVQIECCNIWSQRMAVEIATISVMTAAGNLLRLPIVCEHIMRAAVRRVMEEEDNE